MSYCICHLRCGWELGSRASVCKSSEVLFAFQTDGVFLFCGFVGHCAWFLRWKWIQLLMLSCSICSAVILHGDCNFCC